MGLVIWCIAGIQAAGQALPAEEFEEKTRRVRHSFSMFAGFPGSFQIESVPESIRAVPLHDDDGYLADFPLATQPIVDDTIEFMGALAVGFSYQSQYRWVEAGMRIEFSELDSRRVQQNQFGGTDRGAGTSLRYYEIRDLPRALLSTSLLIGIVVPIRRFARDDRPFDLAFGGEYDPLGTRIDIEAGWDRFDEDQEWRRVKVGRVFRHAFYARLDIGVFSAQINKPEWRIESDASLEGIRVEHSGLSFLAGARLSLRQR